MITHLHYKQKVLLLLHLHLLLSASGHRHPKPSLLTDKAALLAFKSKITSDPQSVLSNWTQDSDACAFRGVLCNPLRRRVILLSLNRTGIAGPISPNLSNLTQLRQLDLSDNSLSGPVPPALALLRRLTALDLSMNRFTGPVPTSFSTLSGLMYLNLGWNQLTGPIPESIIHNCTELRLFDLSNNALSGAIPSFIGDHLRQLLWLNLYSNDLDGEIPASLGNSSGLLLLDIEDNHISGELPVEMVSKLKSMQSLHLSDNMLSSQSNNTDLEPFFVALSNCTELEEIEMAGNGFGGRLTPTIARLGRMLKILHLEENRISGSIPPGIAELSNLTLLNLSSNLLNGTVPAEVGRFQRLERLILSNNLLSGAIPSSIGGVCALGLLDLSMNRLRGEIPASLGNLSRLSELLLHRNSLSGGIPVSLSNCENLNKLDLSYNRLTGLIPPQVSGLVKIFLNLANNLLEGSLPLELSKNNQVQEIDLSSNNLTGDIAPQLSNCVALKLINLSRNSLSGQLPGSLGLIQSLECLDVSYNRLSGEVPTSLSECASLTRLNLSYNDFGGRVPAGGVFSRLSSLSFLGNARLCGPVTGRVCFERKRWLRDHKILILACAIASASAFVLTICAVVGFRKIKRMRALGGEDGEKAGKFSLAWKSSYPRITYRELAEATGSFAQERLIGSGSCGRVYCGTLEDGTVVAVKVLQLNAGNSTKSFNRECQVLKRIRHRNLMRIITACSLADFKALVLPYMANGSLESRLYMKKTGMRAGSSDLDLVQTVSICSDIAEGMAYLHHHSPVKVIHCDLKPSNVLLNEDMTAMVSDFGIARLLMAVGGGGGGGSVTVADQNMGSSSIANMLCGSLGYIAPEYAFVSSASTKGDVYSFGVLVLEIVTRKRPTDDMFVGGLSLHDWVKTNHQQRRVERVVDASLVRAATNQSPEIERMWEVAISELLELGVLCSHENPSSRPTMLDAADDLDRLKRYLAGDSTVTFASSLGTSSSTFGGDS
ncbi:putative leucine-rich repeat receptor-like serine/threonine-protein kinase [Acorus calamus]|uniref:non-specific serine/threonine protein kinase n=1 Tax=Acorus calamus TaxID=4465 RepID=A0AAV9EQE7_ACOCL|nr:putative leucine-rich repeat receptor-like serine/threonine-protein kinase [Acorus calamus]